MERASLERLKVLTYAVTERAATYRAIMRVFADAHDHYVVQLRPEDVIAGLTAGGYMLDSSAEEFSAEDAPGGDERQAVDRALDQLVTWGNLRRTQDTSRAATLADFARRRSLYQITPEGEAAERAVADVADAIGRTGSLQSVMLAAILDNVRLLAAELTSAEPSGNTVYTALFDLHGQFEALTDNAATFLGSLNRAIEATDVADNTFLAYKQAVIVYLDQFVLELGRLAPRIVDTIADVEAAGVERMCALAATADRAPTLDDDAPDPSTRWNDRWRGITSWFVGTGAGAPATVESLRRAAREAVVRILTVLDRLHERRFGRVNRAADLVTLAGWFSDPRACPDDAAGHRLFADAFGLGSARHLGIESADDEATASTSWWDAAPVEVSTRLRSTARDLRTPKVPTVEDTSMARIMLRERAREERAQAQAAVARFAGHGPMRVSQLTQLTEAEFRLFLSIVERALVAPRSEDGSRAARSADGRLTVRLHPPVPGEAAAAVATKGGELWCPNYAIEVTER